MEIFEERKERKKKLKVVYQTVWWRRRWRREEEKRRERERLTLTRRSTHDFTADHSSSPTVASIKMKNDCLILARISFYVEKGEGMLISLALQLRQQVNTFLGG